MQWKMVPVRYQTAYPRTSLYKPEQLNSDLPLCRLLSLCIRSTNSTNYVSQESVIHWDIPNRTESITALTFINGNFFIMCIKRTTEHTQKIFIYLLVCCFTHNKNWLKSRISILAHKLAKHSQPRTRHFQTEKTQYRVWH